MKKLGLCLFCFSFMLCFMLSAYASPTATPSDADGFIPHEDDGTWPEEYDFEDDPEELISEGSLFESQVIERLDLLIGGLIDATPSDATPIVEDPFGLEEPDEIIAFNGPVPLSIANSQNFVNVLRFDVRVSGTAYTLLFSPAYIDQLFVDDGGNLWNMGTANVQGLVVDGNFNPYSTTGTLVYLAPCLGNNFNTNYNYGSPNWFRRYYRSGTSLTYSDTYVRISVDRVYHPFLVGDTLTYILIFLVGGGVLICWLNRFKRY